MSSPYNTGYDDEGYSSNYASSNYAVNDADYEAFDGSSEDFPSGESSSEDFPSSSDDEDLLNSDSEGDIGGYERSFTHPNANLDFVDELESSDLSDDEEDVNSLTPSARLALLENVINEFGSAKFLNGFKNYFDKDLYTDEAELKELENMKRSTFQKLKSLLGTKFGNISQLDKTQSHNIKEHLEDLDNLPFDRNDYLKYHWTYRFDYHRNDRPTLVSLVNDFNTISEKLANIIIMEKSLPYYEKTIKPSSVGGIAGGDKYIAHGIIFKFATDTKLRNGKWLYGGDYRDDFLAAKALHNDLKSLRVFHKIVSENNIPIDIPITCIIDYLGVTLFAASLLPINSTTLVYGTSDAAKTVYDAQDNPELLSYIMKIAEVLSFRAHPVMDGKKNTHELHFAADVEIHQNNGKYYALDFGRFLPPNDPKKPFQNIFREEFMMNVLPKNNLMISCDVFSGFGRIDQSQYESEAAEALKLLIKILQDDFWEEVKNGECQLTKDNVKQMLHERGINLRHMGLLRHSCTAEKLGSEEDAEKFRRILLIEMICRSTKTLLARKLYKQLNKHCVPIEDIYRRKLLKLYEKLKNPEDVVWSSPSKLKKEIVTKYSRRSLTDEEFTDMSLLVAVGVDREKMKNFLTRIAEYGRFKIGLTKSETEIMLHTKSIVGSVMAEDSLFNLMDDLIEDEELWNNYHSYLYEWTDTATIDKFLVTYLGVSENVERINTCIEYLIDKFSDMIMWDLNCMLPYIRHIWNKNLIFHSQIIINFAHLIFKYSSVNTTLKENIEIMCSIDSRNAVKLAFNEFLPVSKNYENKATIMTLVYGMMTESIYNTKTPLVNTLGIFKNLNVPVRNLCLVNPKKEHLKILSGLLNPVERLTIVNSDHIDQASFSCENVTYLCLLDSEISALGNYPNLHELVIDNLKNSDTLSQANTRYPKLKKIDVQITEKLEADFISHLAGLKLSHLHIQCKLGESRINNSNIAELVSFNELISLKLNFCLGEVNSFEPISSMRSLEYLSIQTMSTENHLADFISKIDTLQNLSHLDLSFNNHSSDDLSTSQKHYAKFKFLNSLTYLNLSHSTGITDNILKKFPNGLVHLDISYTPIQIGTGGPPHFPNLKTLNLSGCIVNEKFDWLTSRNLDTLLLKDIPQYQLFEAYLKMHSVRDVKDSFINVVDRLLACDAASDSSFLNPLKIRSGNLYDSNESRFCKKVISVSCGDLELLHEEIDKRMKLRHPYIVSLSYGEYRDNCLIIVEEKMEMDLQTYLNNEQYLKRLVKHPYEISKLLMKILKGLEFLHTQEITHGDLRFSNILLNIDYQTGNILEVKLNDFGFTCKSKLIDHTRLPSAVYEMEPYKRDYFCCLIMIIQLLSKKVSQEEIFEIIAESGEIIDNWKHDKRHPMRKWDGFFKKFGTKMIKDRNFMKELQRYFCQNEFKISKEKHQREIKFWTNSFKFEHEVPTLQLWESLKAKYFGDNSFYFYFKKFFPADMTTIEEFCFFVSRVGNLHVKITVDKSFSSSGYDQGTDIFTVMQELCEYVWFWGDNKDSTIADALQNQIPGNYFAIRYSSRGWEMPFTLFTSHNGINGVAYIEYTKSSRTGEMVYKLRSSEGATLKEFVEAWNSNPKNTSYKPVPGSPYGQIPTDQTIPTSYKVTGYSLN